MAPVGTGASTEGHSLTTGVIGKMVAFLRTYSMPLTLSATTESDSLALRHGSRALLPSPSTVGFAVLIAGFCLVARRVRRARISTLTRNHTPFISRPSCPRCLANRRDAASAPRANRDWPVSSPASTSSSPPPPYRRPLSPVQLPELPGMGLTGLEELALPATPPPVYRATRDEIALTPLSGRHQTSRSLSSCRNRARCSLASHTSIGLG